MSDHFPDFSPHVRRIAEAVVDGDSLDWTAASVENMADEDRRVIAQLRLISRIASLQAMTPDDASHSGLQHRGPDVDSVPGRWGLLQVLERVGSGHFGDVYRAWDPALDRDVALKLLRYDSGASDASAIVDEGRVMARVRHPNVVTILGAQRIEGRTGLWMEFIRGKTLAAALAERGPFDAAELAHVGVGVARALTAVHDAGLVHRDVKAQNVMQEDGGRIVLGDFGIGREVDALRRGEVAGTPACLAPEIFRGELPTPHSDLYSLGALLFYLATGAYPVPGRDFRELRESHARGERRSLQQVRPDLPRRLQQVIERALAAEPANRFVNAEAMIEALTAPAITAPHRRARVFAAYGAAVTAAIAVFAGLTLWMFAAWGGALVLPPIPERAGASGMSGFTRAGVTPSFELEMAAPFPAPDEGGDSGASTVSVPEALRAASSLTQVDAGFAQRIRIYAASANPQLVTCTIAGRQAIGVCDLRLSTVRELRGPGTGERGALPVISPDGRTVLYGWQTKAGWSVREVDISGENDREVIPVEPGLELLQLHWIDGGRSIAVLRNRPSGNTGVMRYEVFPAGGGVPRHLWTFDGRAGADSIDLSRDGRYIAMDVPGAGNDRDLVTIDTATGREQPLLMTPSADIKPRWAPDGKSLVYQSDGQGVRGLYAIRVAAGQAVGAPVLVRDVSRGRMTPVGFADDGTMLVERLPYWYKSYRAQVNLSRGVVELPRWLDTRAGADETPGVAVSPDGQRVAYVAGNLDDPTSAPARIVLLRRNGGWDRDIALSGEIVRKSRVRWSSDSQRLAVTTRKQERIVIDILDAVTGALLHEIPAPGAWDLKWDPRGEGLYYATGTEVVRYDPHSGKRDTMYRSSRSLEQTATFDVSPLDGSLLLPISMPVGAVAAVVRSDGQMRPYAVQGTPVALAWVPDGTRFVISSIRDARYALLTTVETDSGTASHLRVEAKPIVDISFGSEDEMFFAAGNPIPEYWALTGFLPR